MNELKKIAIFGTGDFGKKAYKYFGEERVAIFLDNDIKKQGNDLYGLHIVSLDEYMLLKYEYELVVAVRDNEAIIRQLIEKGFEEFYTFVAFSVGGLLHKVDVETWKVSKEELRRRNLLNKKDINVKEGIWDICLTGLYTELNYGAELTCLALYEYLNLLGYTVLMNQQPLSANIRPNRFPLLFKENPYPIYDLSEVFEDIDAMKELNVHAKYFVLGSDQMWNEELMCNRGNISYMKFVASDKKQLSYATSFGKAFWEADETCTENMQDCLKRFFAISVREESGVNICKEQFGQEAVQCMDPVFLMNTDFYRKLASKSELQLTGTSVSSYIFYNDKLCSEEIEKFAERNNLQLNVINPISMFAEDWLRQISGSKILITNSFHAMCFAIIFRVDFIAVEFKWSSRVYELLRMLGLESRIVRNIEEINSKDALLQKIDYDSVYKILNEKISFSKKWLKDRLVEMEKEYVE